MKRFTHILDFGTELLLASVFLLIIVSTFVVTLNLSPKTIKRSDVLGVFDTNQDIDFIATTDSTSDITIDTQFISQGDISQKISLDNLEPGIHSGKALDIVNNTNQNQLVYINKTSIGELARLEILADSKDYVIFDKQANIDNDLELKIPSGSTTQIQYILTIDEADSIDNIIIDFSASS